MTYLLVAVVLIAGQAPMVESVAGHLDERTCNEMDIPSYLDAEYRNMGDVTYHCVEEN